MRGKVVINFVILLLMVLAIIPWADGFIFKRGYYRFIKALAADKAVNIKILEYQQGWFHSTAKIAMTSKTNPVNTPSVSVSIILEQNISHGPLVRDAASHRWIFALAAVQGKVHLPAALEAVLLGNLSNQNGVLDSHAIVTFGGDYLSQINTPVFNVHIPRIVDIVWQGLNGYMNFHMSGRHLQKMTTDITIGAIAAKSVMGSITTKEVAITYDISPNMSGLWNGTYYFKAPELTFAGVDGVFSVRNLNTSYTFGAASSDLYNAKIQFLLGQLVTPQFGVNASHINLSLENMRVSGLLNLVKTANSLKNRAMQLTSAQSQHLMALMPTLITPVTLVKGDTVIDTSYGKVWLNGQAAWPMTVKTIDDVFNGVTGKVDMRISAGLVDYLMTLMVAHEMNAMLPSQAVSPVDKMRAQWSRWVQQGFIIQDKTDYVTALTLERGIFKANGIQVY